MIINKAHFIWFGDKLPWANSLAVESAARYGGFDKVIFHFEKGLGESAALSQLVKHPNIEMRELSPISLLGNIDGLGVELVNIFNRLESFAAKANMVRAAILLSEGGVYLDTDTVTLRSFTPLLDTGVFCGCEHIALPGELFATRLPGPWIKAGLKLAARDICRRIPKGWRMFKKIEHFYQPAVNNAVLGAEKGHEFIRELMQRMIALPGKQQLVRYALGSHLIQSIVAESFYEDLTIHPPEYFYPLGPEISQHWFREYPSLHLDEILTQSTYCVHWYGSVKTTKSIPKINPDFIKCNSGTQLYSALVRPLV